MFVWRLWGNVWAVGDGEDYVAWQITWLIFWIVLLSIVSIAWLVIWGTYKLFQLSSTSPLLGIPLLLTWLGFLGWIIYAAAQPPKPVTASPSEATRPNSVAASPVAIARPTTTPVPVVVPGPAATKGTYTVVVSNTSGIGVYLRGSTDMADKLLVNGKPVAWPDKTKLEVLGEAYDSHNLRWFRVRDPAGHVGFIRDEYTNAVPVTPSRP